MSMTRQERLKFCKTCQKRKFDFNRGILCSITNDLAAFEDSCPDYLIDEKVQALETYKSDQAEIDKQKAQQRRSERKQRRKENRATRKGIPERIRLNDLYLLIGSALITVYVIRLILYVDFSYNSVSGTLMLFPVILFSSIITLFLRKRKNWSYRFFGDMLFKLVYSALVALFNVLYALIVIPIYFSPGSVFINLFIITFIISFFSVIFVIPISFIYRSTIKSNVKTK